MRYRTPKAVMQIDWGLAQLQFEVFGVSINKIAEEYNVNPVVVEYAAEEHGWEKNDLALTLSNKLEVGDVDEDLLQTIGDRLNLLYTLKTSALMPSYVMLEAALLGKCISHVKALDSSDPAAITSFKMVAEILSVLRDKANGGMGMKKDEGNGAITVKILNQINREQQSQTAIEVSM